MTKVNNCILMLAMCTAINTTYAWGQKTGEVDSLLEQVERFSVKRGTEQHKTIADFRNAQKRLSEMRSVEKVRLIKESKRLDKGWEYRCAIMRIIAPIQESSVADTLIANLNSDNMKLRACAAKMLGEQKGEKVIDSLIAQLPKGDASVRANSAYSLGKIKNARAVPALKKSVADKDTIISANSIWAIGEIADPLAVDFLLDSMRSSDETRKINIIVALSKIKSEKALQALKKISAADSEPEPVRGLATDIVTKLEKGMSPW